MTAPTMIAIKYIILYIVYIFIENLAGLAIKRIYNPQVVPASN